MFKKATRYLSAQKTNGMQNKKLDKSTQENKESIPKSITSVKDKLDQKFSFCSDFILREVEFGKAKTKMMIAFIDGFVNDQVLDQSVIEPIVRFSEGNAKDSVLKLLKENVISTGALSELSYFDETVDSILNGDAVIYIDGQNKALEVGVKSPEKRTVEQPDTEISLKGSREGFVESLRTNTILLRRRIKNAQFKIETLKLGEQTKTDVAICYIQGIVHHEIIDEVKNRVGRIRIDSILGSGYIEQFIQDGRIPLVPMIGNSEKPDRVAAKLLEGRVAIIVDGTPTVLTVPFVFIESIQAQEDYFGEYYFASFIRLIRLMALMISIYLPALYVAMISFHQTIIPFKLMLTVAASREGIPFSAFLEALLMVITFEILREAGVRMPRAIGQAVSIVGAIVLGDAAVNAGIASAPLVIVAALSGICSFIVPPMMKVGSILRILMLIAANILGLLGIAVTSIILLVYLCNKRSFGIPYLVPFSPLHTADLKDSLIVVPIWAMVTRPRALMEGRNTVRTTGKSYSRKGGVK